MTDIMERLRKAEAGCIPEAIAEIERLREQWEHFSKLASEHRNELEDEIERLRQQILNQAETIKVLMREEE